MFDWLIFFFKKKSAQHVPHAGKVLKRDFRLMFFFSFLYFLVCGEGGLRQFSFVSVIVGSHGSPQPQQLLPFFFGWFGTSLVCLPQVEGSCHFSGRRHGGPGNVWLLHADSLVDNRGHRLARERRDPSIQNPVNLFFLPPQSPSLFPGGWAAFGFQGFVVPNSLVYFKFLFILFFFLGRGGY